MTKVYRKWQQREGSGSKGEENFINIFEGANSLSVTDKRRKSQI